MSAGAGIDTLFDGVAPNRFLIQVWITCAAVLLLDGYDLTVIALMAPGLVKDFGLEEASLGPVFSASLVGMVLGGPLGGWLGDRHGRKLAVISSCFVFGLATFAMLAATTAPQLVACRFVVGLGLGVALATTIALSAEFTPGRMRNRVMALIGTSVPLGAIIPGVLTATLTPEYGWRLLVVVGGVFPVMLAIVLIWAMPESIRYLALRPALSGRLSAVLKRISPDLQWIPNSASFSDEGARSVSPTRLLGDGLAAITLSMWVLFFVNAMALYLLMNWLPLVLQSSGMSVEQAGQVTALFAAAGLIGGLVVTALIPWAGVAIVPTMFIISIPFLVMFATFDLSYTAVILCVLIPGLACGAIQVACSTLAGMLYPTEIRVTGVGWAVAVGRAGAIFGPIFGAVVFSWALPPQQMFAFAAAPMLIGAIGAITFSVLCLRRFASLQIDHAARHAHSSATAHVSQTDAEAVSGLQLGKHLK